MRRRYAAFVVRARWAVVAAWVLAAILSVAVLPGVGSGGSLGALVPSDSPAIDAERRAAELFGFPVLSRVAVVERKLPQLSSADVQRVTQLGALLSAGSLPAHRKAVLGAFPLINRFGPDGLVRDRNTTAITYLLTNPDYGTGRTNRAALALVEAQVSPFADSAGVTGALPARAAQVDVIAKRLPLVELGTVLLVALAVGLYFRSLVAPFLVLVSIALPYVVAVHFVSGVGNEIGLPMPKEVEPVMVVLLFGILTDYALLLLSRFRRRLAEGEDPREAAEGTIADQAGIIATAGVAVIAGMLSLLAARLSFFHAFGPGVAVAVAIGLLAALTFLPAMLAICGARVFWPSPRAPAVAPAPPRARSLELAARRPVTVVVGCVVALGILATGLTRLDTGQTLIRGLPNGSGAREAYEQVRSGFVPGVLSPTVVLVEGDAVTGQRAELIELQRRLAGVRGVAAMIGPRQQQLKVEFGAVYAPSGDAARMLAIFDSDPLGSRAIRTLGRLDRALVDSDLDARMSLVGDTAIAAEVVRGSSADLGRIGPIAALAIALIMGLFLRALVAPLYMLAASALGLAAALGLTVYVFQGLLGYSELTYYVPFVASVLLLSLGSDYTVFLAGHVWEQARHHDLRTALVLGGSRAAAAITVAGVVLALSFALLALVPLQPFRELAFVMTVGLLLDAFVVRTLLVPALIALVGERGGWPGGALRD